MNDDDIDAFNPPPRPAPLATPASPRRRLWPWLLGAAALLLVVLVAAGAWALLALLEDASEGVQVFANGEPWDAGSAGLAGLLGVGGALLVALLAVMLVVLLGMFLVVPLLLLVCVLLAAGLGLGGALLAAALVAAVVLSPLWLFGLLLWLLLRRTPKPVPTRMTV